MHQHAVPVQLQTEVLSLEFLLADWILQRLLSLHVSEPETVEPVGCEGVAASMPVRSAEERSVFARTKRQSSHGYTASSQLPGGQS